MAAANWSTQRVTTTRATLSATKRKVRGKLYIHGHVYKGEWKRGMSHGHGNIVHEPPVWGPVDPEVFEIGRKGH